MPRQIITYTDQHVISTFPHFFHHEEIELTTLHTLLQADYPTIQGTIGKFVKELFNHENFVILIKKNIVSTGDPQLGTKMAVNPPQVQMCTNF